MFEQALVMLQPAAAPLAFLESLVLGGRRDERLVLLLAAQRLLHGQLTEASACLDGVAPDAPEALRVVGWLAFARQDLDAAAMAFNKAQDRYADLGAESSSFIANSARLWHVVTLLYRGDYGTALKLCGTSGLAVPEWLADINNHLETVARVGMETLRDRDYKIEELFYWWRSGGAPLKDLFRLLACYWINQDKARKCLDQANTLRSKLIQSGYQWLLTHVDELAGRLTTGTQTSHSVLLDAMRRSQPWQRSLAALEQLLKPAEKPPPAKPVIATESKSRIAWLLTLEHGHCYIKPVEQMSQGRKGWSKGRPVALKRLYDSAGRMSQLTPTDQRIVSFIDAETHYSHGYPDTTYFFDIKKALRAMVGHPHIFMASNPAVPVEVMEGPPVLEVTEQGHEVVISFSPILGEHADYAVVQESPSRVKLVDVPDGLQRFAAVVGSGIRVPSQALDQVVRLLEPLSKVVTVHSGVGHAAGSVRHLAADPTPVMQLRRHGNGLTVQLLVRPFGAASETGPLLTGGQGTETVIAEVDGQRIQAQRDLASEQARIEELLDNLPRLRGWPCVAGEWIIDSTQDCLELLTELEELEGQNVVKVEWPAGERVKLLPAVAATDINIQLHQTSGGYSVSGELAVAPSVELQLPQLLDLLQASPGRFVRLPEGEFLTLTHQLRQQLDSLDAVSERRKGLVCIHPVALGVLADWMQPEGPFAGDDAFVEHAKRVCEAQTLITEVPATFAGELRPYQAEAFRWMMRLAHWGAGACLADDMGLGKTIECLAMLLARAARSIVGGGPHVRVHGLGARNPPLRAGAALHSTGRPRPRPNRGWRWSV